jgi:hypothetical protein
LGESMSLSADATPGHVLWAAKSHLWYTLQQTQPNPFISKPYI